MKSISRKLVGVFLLSALVVPVASFAANAANGTVGAPVQGTSADASSETVAAVQQSFEQLQERMLVRMRAMQQLTDPQARSALMTAQMQDMQETMRGARAGCPMLASHREHPMGRMMGMKGGHGMHGDVGHMGHMGHMGYARPVSPAGEGSSAN